jgi:hypothetical protein
MEVNSGAAVIEESREEAASFKMEDYAMLDVELSCSLLLWFDYLLWCKSSNCKWIEACEATSNKASSRQNGEEGIHD